MHSELITTIILTVIGSNALWGFFQFILQRHDTKNDKFKKIFDAIDEIKEKITKMDAESQEDKAVTARVRILRFMDELLEGRRHTKDSYEQCNSDITFYLNYCKENPDFKNHQTEATIEFITKNYQERLEKNDFL